MVDQPIRFNRRALMISGAAAGFGALAGSASGPRDAAPGCRGVAMALRPGNGEKTLPASLDPRLLDQAMAALDKHAHQITRRDRIAIVDFTAPSSEGRLHFLDLESGKASRLLVAHGTGSDPRHTGFLHSFSNVFGSNASSEGAFLTDDYYVGKHGRSQRLVGLDPTNNNARDRAIVIHGAWYANADMIAAHGKLGRSQGCFAVGDGNLGDVFDYLGRGRLLYAGRG